MTTSPPVSRRVPVWLWVVIAVVVVAAAVTAVLLVTSRHPVSSASHSPSPRHSATASSTPTPTPTPTGTAVAGGATFDSSMDEFVGDALDTQNTAVFPEGGYFPDPVDVVIAASDQNGPMHPDDAEAAMQFMFTPGAEETWDLALPASTIDAYRAGPYGYFFPVGAIVARSPDGHVFSFVGHGMTVTHLYMSASEDLLLGH